jgi:hypothetical protein
MAQLSQWLTDRGQAETARALLADSPAAGARLQEAYLDCQASGELSPARLSAARAALGRSLDDYDVTAMIVVVNLALDGTCTLSVPELLGLVEAAAGLPRVSRQHRQNLWMYVGHLRHALHDAAGAEAALEAAFAAYPKNPVPLLLAANWRLDADDPSGALALMERARAAPASRRLNLEGHYRELEGRLRAGGP